MWDVVWMRDGACRETDPGTFFPPDNGGLDAAKRICATCPVQTDCLEYALKYKINHGVWGGESERARQRIQRARRSQRKGAA